jgi:hypothetical protein
MKKKVIPASQLLDEYLKSVDGMQEAETDPFFYTRLHARMQKQPAWLFPLRPAWIITGLALLLLLNGFMTINKFTAAGQSAVVGVSPLQDFATAYDLTIQSTY